MSTPAAPSSDANTFQRQVFTTSRLLEYFSEKELTLQTGHGPDNWPTVVLKELVDNALDACEESRTPPEITVALDSDRLAVTDNGPGIAPEVVTSILDFGTKTSSRDFYVSPTRGAQGNALKTILAIPYVLSGCVSSEVEIESRGVRNSITITVDRIRQVPVIAVDRQPSEVKTGTIVRIGSAELARSAVESGGLQFLQRYSLLNPHSSFHWSAADTHTDAEASCPTWEKWTPGNPIPPHWYSLEQFIALTAARISASNGGFVRDMVAEFRGLSSTAKQRIILGYLELTGAPLDALVRDGAVDRKLALRLLTAMQIESREVKPPQLGVIGEDHIQAQLVSRGCNEHSIRYKRLAGVTARRPYVLEVAFGAFEDRDESREVVCGLNFSPCIGNPFSRVTQWESLDGILGEQFVDDEAGGLVLVHLTTPHLQYSDRGKSQVELPPAIGEDLKLAVQAVTKEWKRISRQQFRDSDRAERQRERMMRAVNPKRTIKDVVCGNMMAAYDKASGNGKHVTSSRQVFYQMRPIVLAELPDENLQDSYFTQNLLPEYLRDHPMATADWDIVSDARGHLAEPHTRRKIPLGTLDVRRYAQAAGVCDATKLPDAPECPSLEFETCGPANRFRNVLFIEKEGFLPLLESASIAERYDLAIMTPKGMSTNAARDLMQTFEGVRFLVLHDFDKAGFSIVGTLTRDTWKYKFKRPPEVIDLGLRLADVRSLKLESEPVTIKGDAEDNLRLNRATEDEIAFLTGTDTGKSKRVELNAMTSPQFIEWLETKLKHYKVGKYVPGDAVLKMAYQRAWLLNRLNAEIEKAYDGLKQSAERLLPPGDLLGKVLDHLKRNPREAWDSAVADAAKEAA
jgi:DNA topoisomerase VI subunit B